MMMMQKLAQKQAHVVVLDGMVGEDDADDPELAEDVGGECGRFGTVEEVRVEEVKRGGCGSSCGLLTRGQWTRAPT